jgi:hypothetical protein
MISIWDGMEIAGRMDINAFFDRALRIKQSVNGVPTVTPGERIISLDQSLEPNKHPNASMRPRFGGCNFLGRGLNNVMNGE